MDPVLVDELAFERPKRVEAHVQRHARTPDAAIGQRGQQLGGEVEPGGRCGRRARRLGVDGLVALGRCGSIADVRRERHLAGCGHDRMRIAVEADRSDAVGEMLPHLDRLAVAQLQHLAHPHLS